MSLNININQFKLEFSDRVELLLQESGGRLRDTVNIQTFTGSRSGSPVNQVGAIQGSTPAGRFAPLNRVDAPNERRWVDPIDRELTQQLDRFDMLKYTQDFKAPYAENAAKDFGRFMDQLIIDSAPGTAKTGELGSGSEAFDTANFRIAADFGAGSAIGLSVAKLLQARQLLAEAHVNLDDDPLTIIITPKQETDLLNEIQVTSTEFTRTARLEEGRVRSFLGFRFIVKTQNANDLDATALPVINVDERRVLVYVKSGVTLGIWKDMAAEVDRIPTLSSIPWQIYTSGSAGATRMEQGKVLEILCKE